MDLFDQALNQPATLAYEGCKHKGTIIEIRWIDGELHYHIQFPDFYETKSGIKKSYNWSAIYPQDYVIILA